MNDQDLDRPTSLCHSSFFNYTTDTQRMNLNAQIKGRPFIGGFSHTTRRQKTGQILAAPKSPAKPEQETSKDNSFRWNPAQSRWERVKPGSGRNKTGKYTQEKWEEGGAATIQTKTGGSYVVWPVIHAYLTDNNVKSLTPEEVYRLQQEEGALLVDCRVPWDFERQKIEGAISVPLWRGVAGKTAWDTFKRAVMAVGFAMKATERDPAFQQTCEEKLPKNKKIIVYCGLGGTLDVGALPYKPGGKSFKDDPERMFGRESRSLKAIYELLQAGYRDVDHLKGGLSQWRHDGYPVD